MIEQLLADIPEFIQFGISGRVSLSPSSLFLLIIGLGALWFLGRVIKKRVG